ncbi:MAG: hypothetical protein CR965_00965 [Paludibacter sp.]|nr:MAG: hypothetical protein CR965_00965 [Paludibacter sp.]
MAKRKQEKPLHCRKTLRKHQHSFALNDLENKALSRYLKKYKIDNKSKFIREVVMYEVISRLEKNSPTLFESENQ